MELHRTATGHFLTVSIHDCHGDIVGATIHIGYNDLIRRCRFTLCLAVKVILEAVPCYGIERGFKSGSDRHSSGIIPQRFILGRGNYA